ncbi:hypothetical protein KEM56_006878 [Ascosphaera pollenicola]|nr:hypothetical protein KEM56_006878 [Ascosphaera pollenicola]
MSFKSKDLHYDKNEPTFLKKLRSQYASSNNPLDRTNRPATAKRLLNDPDEDEPTYVDEESNEVVSREEYRSMVRGEEEKQSQSQSQHVEGGEGEEGKEGVERGKVQPTAEIGGVKRKKQVRVIDGDGDDEEKSADGDDQKPIQAPKARQSTKKAQQKRKKKIKLSYDADEEEDDG